jgi:hypothetical protein
MLTKKQILGAARLMQTYGHLRPGYVDHNSNHLTGPDGGECFFDTTGEAGRETAIEIVETTDPITGERRVVPKR